MSNIVIQLRLLERLLLTGGPSIWICAWRDLFSRLPKRRVSGYTMPYTGLYSMRPMDAS